jgi:hypothetical protein
MIFPIVKDYWSAVEKSGNAKMFETRRKNKRLADSIWEVMTDEAKRMAADLKGTA